MNRRTIHVVGSVNEDLRLQVITPPRPGETVLASASETELGGKGANQAVAARKAGADVRFIAAVGTDASGDAILAELDGFGLDVRAVDRIDSAPTGRAVVMVSDSGENQITIARGANEHVSVDAVSKALDEALEGDLVVLQLELPLDVVGFAAGRAHERGCYVILNAAPVDVSALPLLPNIDLLVVNEHEIAGLTGSSVGEHLAASKALTERYDVDVLCTLGSEGAVLVTADGTIEQSARRVDARDTTGAGDTFIGYLAAGLAIDSPWPAVLLEATAASAITVTRRGAARSIPFHHELGGSLAADLV